MNEDNVHNAFGLMARYVMANPTIRTLYQQNKCDGYSDSYTDLYPGTIRDDHYDYQRVMDGVVNFDTQDDRWEIKYYTDYSDQDEELSPEDKFTILDTWNAACNVIARGLDPTDPDKDLL